MSKIIRGLVGANLSHSYSKIIHESFDDSEYKLISLDKEELCKLVNDKNFDYLNVTIPYKEEVYNLIDNYSDQVKDIKAVNFVLNRNGVLIGYNTDYLAFKKVLDENSINLIGKSVLILGSGGTSKMVRSFLKEKNIDFTICSRSIKEDGYTSYDILQKSINNYDVIINTTPVGMYPNINDTLLDLDMFPNLNLVIDFIYNPYRTILIQKAQERNIKTINGLSILIYQAILSFEIFSNKKLDSSCYENIINLLMSKRNIVLIGMPLSGKTRIGEDLLDIMPNKKLIDTDKIIEKEYGSIEYLFRNYNEEYFRDLEYKIISNVSRKENLIISTGGGVVKRKENIRLLKANGIVIFIDVALDLLLDRFSSGTRPLLKSKDDLIRIYHERRKMYLDSCDVVIPYDDSVLDKINNIK